MYVVKQLKGSAQYCCGSLSNWLAKYNHPQCQRLLTHCSAANEGARVSHNKVLPQHVHG